MSDYYVRILMCCRAAYCLGEHTLKIPMELHKVNRERLCKRLKENKEVPKGAVIVLQGGDEFQRYCSDVEVTTFRQVCGY